tara:strand:+ start:463 stop:690 length:228 start_codon:yes stop_codon:yes gene_type:complete
MTNHRETRYGKGDFRRPENSDQFSANFDKIFGKRDVPQNVQRKSYETNETLRVQNQTTEEWLAEYEEALRENDLP